MCNSGRVETRRLSTASAACTSVPVLASAQSIWLMPTLASAAKLARNLERQARHRALAAAAFAVLPIIGLAAHTA